MSIFAPILMYWKTLATRRAVETEIDAVVEGWQKQISGLYDLASSPGTVITEVSGEQGHDRKAGYINSAIRWKLVADRRDVITMREAELELLGDYINACLTLLQAPQSVVDLVRQNILKQKLDEYTGLYAKKRAKLSGIQTLSSRIQVESTKGRLNRVDMSKAKRQLAFYWADLRAQTLESVLAEQPSRFSGSRLADICNAYEAQIVKNEERADQLSRENRGRLILSPKVFVAREEQVANNEIVSSKLSDNIPDLPSDAQENLDSAELTSALEAFRFFISGLTDSRAVLLASNLETIQNIQAVEIKLDVWREREELARQHGNALLLANAQNAVINHQEHIKELEALRVAVQMTMEPIANRIDRLEKVSLLLQEQIEQLYVPPRPL